MEAQLRPLSGSSVIWLVLDASADGGGSLVDFAEPRRHRDVSETLGQVERHIDGPRLAHGETNAGNRTSPKPSCEATKV